MKRLLLFGIILQLGILIGCSSDAPTGSTGGIGGVPGGGGGGGGAVTWTIGQRQGTQGIIFTAQPSTAVTVTQVTVSLTAANFQEVLQGDGTTVYASTQAVDLSEYTGVATGQAWTFAFVGKLGSATGADYSVTSNYTIP